jgi:hypothetical protein
MLQMGVKQQHIILIQSAGTGIHVRGASVDGNNLSN